MTKMSMKVVASAAVCAALFGCATAPDAAVEGCCCESAAACTACAKCSIQGVWGMKLPYAELSAGWLKVDGNEVTFLWRWASPFKMVNPVVTANSVSFKMSPDGDGRTRNFTFTAKGNQLAGVEVITDKDGKVESTAEFAGYRIPPVGPAPELSAAVYGAPIDLFEDGLDGWESMSETAHFGWSFKDGVLSNRIDHNAKNGNANLISKRADFFDFRLSYDVRVLPGCNSGVYLRGRYEIQVIDSFGHPVDCHNMAAFYGRITPSVAAERKANEWQHVDVTLYKRHVTVVLNGVKIIDNKPIEGVTGGALDANEFVPGPIYLQGDHSDADYKNVFLTPILR